MSLRQIVATQKMTKRMSATKINREERVIKKESMGLKIENKNIVLSSVALR
jgi:hypothetical protein